MTKRQLIDYCLTFPDSLESYPFDTVNSQGSWTVVRHKTSRKGFAHIFERDGNLCINLKCDPIEADFYRHIYVGVSGAYHMNKTHWNTVIEGSDVPIEELKKMIKKSYHLTSSKLKKDI